MLRFCTEPRVFYLFETVSGHRIMEHELRYKKEMVRRWLFDMTDTEHDIF